jgi:preprotein translocase subunit YajC
MNSEGPLTMKFLNTFATLTVTLITLATAGFADDAAPAAQQPQTWEMLVMPIGLVAIMFFFLILPQQRKMKTHQSMLASLKPGDEVVTTGGIIGRIKSIQDTFVSLEVAANTVIKVVKTEVSGLTTKSQTPAKA